MALCHVYNPYAIWAHRLRRAPHAASVGTAHRRRGRRRRAGLRRLLVPVLGRVKARRAAS